MNQFTVVSEIAKKDEERRLVFGWANVSMDKGQMVVDSHGDQIPPDVLEKAAYSYLATFRSGGFEHYKMGVATPVESAWIDQDKLSAMGVDAEFSRSGWWVGFRVDDPEVWAMVKSGKLGSFSIGGVASFAKEKE